MTTIAGVRIENPSTDKFTVLDGENTQILAAATPGKPGVLDLQIKIATYTIKNGSLVAGSITLDKDAKVTIAPGNGGLTTPISIITQLAPKK
ncbi:hypothetical protein E5D57_001631 [Metarhizium anisopliae]|nr:hypothetical protein E5D57_001631 [Metarhizium anisopliae]